MNYTGTLNFYDTITVNFPMFTGSDNKVYKYYIITELPADDYRGNDTITGYIYTYTTPMMVLFERFTQHNCGPCASADPYQLNIYQSHVDTAYHIGMITYHAWWPGSNNDPFYKYDTMPQRQRIVYYGVNAVPWVVLNGVNNVGPDWTTWASQVSYEESYRKTPVEFKFDVSNTFVDLNGDGFISLWIKQIGEMVNKPYNLRVVIVQDSVYYNAPNGTNFHIMKFRQWRDTSFTALAVGDSVYYSVPFNLVVPPTYPTDPGIELDKLVAVVFIQSDDDKKVWGVGTFPVGRFLGVSERASKSIPKVEVVKGGVKVFSPSKQRVEIKVYSASGRLVKVYIGEFAGWKEFKPVIPKGVYIAEVKIGGNKWLRKFFRL